MRSYYKKRILCGLIGIVFCTLCHVRIYAQQFPGDTIGLTEKYAPRIDTIGTPKRFWRASGELLLGEIVPFTVNRYVRNKDFARISFKSIFQNFDPSHWEWDDNSFAVNQFAHPYHGSFYYNSFRTNGYDFWQSAPAPFIGSLAWEIAGENNAGAPNDFINTSFGGVALGEITYRLSKKIINNRQRGFKRTMQEVAALVVNPINGFNRILDGKWGKVYYDPDDTVSIPVSAVLDLGGRRFSRSVGSVIDKGSNEFYMRLSLVYGEQLKTSKVPFSCFSVQAEVGSSDSTYLNTMLVNGFVRRWVLGVTAGGKHMAAITMNFDYYKNTSFEYGDQSFYYKIFSDWNKIGPFKLNTMLGGGVIVLAAVPDPYLYYGEGRNYDYGPGVSITGNAEINYDRAFFTFNYRGGWFKTVNGNTSNFFLNFITAELRYQITRRFSLASEVGHFTLDGHFKHYDDINRRYPYVRASVGYRLFDVK